MIEYETTTFWDRCRRDAYPSIQPISVPEAKLQAEYENSDKDSQFASWIQSATEEYEDYEGRSYITTAWTWNLDWFPPGRFIYVPRSPLVAVTSIQYYDEAGTQQTLSSSVYNVNVRDEPGVISLAPDSEWPVVQAERRNAVTIAFTAGYGTAAENVPPRKRDAIAVLVASKFENRLAFQDFPLHKNPACVALADRVFHGVV